MFMLLIFDSMYKWIVNSRYRKWVWSEYDYKFEYKYI